MENRRNEFGVAVYYTRDEINLIVGFTRSVFVQGVCGARRGADNYHPSPVLIGQILMMFKYQPSVLTESWFAIL